MNADMRRLCARLRAIHREIRAEFDKIDKRLEWTYSLKGVTVKYDPREAAPTIELDIPDTAAERAALKEARK